MNQHKNSHNKRRNVKVASPFSTSQIDPPVFSRREFLVSGLLSSVMLLSGSAAWAKDPEERAKVGFIYPDSGEMEQEAKSLMAGFDLFFDNDGPCPVDVYKKPFQANSDEIGETLEKWINDDNVRFIVLFADVESSEKAVKTCAAAKTILFIANRSVKLVSGEICNTNVFRVSANNYVMSEPLAPWAIQNCGTKVFITGDNDRGGNERSDFFAFGFERAGGAFVDRVMSDGTAESVQSVLTSIANSETDFVFACFEGQSAENFLKAFSAQAPRHRKTVIGPETLTSFDVKSGATQEMILNIPALTNVLNPGSIKSKIVHLYGAMPLSIARASEGHDLGQIIDILAKEQFLQTKDFDTLVKYVADSKFNGLRGAFKFDKNHDAVVESWVTAWESRSGGVSQKVLASLGPSASLDFGCGKVGYPNNRHDSTSSGSEGVWEENGN
ncbi:MAG: ABC transporter substrate-binding protein [Desulfomonilaceae bacterium]